MVRAAGELSNACELKLLAEGKKWVVRKTERMKSNLPDYCLELCT